MKYKILLASIITLCFTLRFWRVGSIPNGFYSDEAAFGYNAYSILKTGKDEYGAFLPVSLKSFGDYKASLYAYYLVPFVAVGGLNETSIRLGSVVLGVAIVILSYSVSYEILKRRRISLLTSFALSISPLMIQFQRMQHENNLSFFLMLLGIYFFLRSLHKPILLFSSVFVFSLSIYSYHDTKTF
jgi:4-amino-4-deoxy-L-arabinose transferase-like glycosyltransferase